MKIQLNYDPVSGAMTTDSGLHVGAWVGLPLHEVQVKETRDSVASLIKLKNAGFTAQEIIEFQSNGVI